MELGRALAGDDRSNNPHTRAGDYLRRWLNEGVLLQEAQPALYLVATSFEAAGSTTTRWGVIAAVGLEPFAQGQILPHERTYSKVKTERLSLMRACRANLSPIFAFFSDQRALLPLLVDRVTPSPPAVEFYDHAQHQYRMWIITEPDLHRLVADHLTKPSLFIADGHHRYETALMYRDTLAEAEGHLPEDHAANFTLMYISSIQDPGLIILPAHRLLPRVDPEMRRTFLKRAETFFHIEKLASQGGAEDNLASLQAHLDATQPGRGLVVGISGQDAPYLLQIKDGCEDRLYPETTPGMMRDIDVTLLNDVIFPQLLGLSPEQLDDVERVRYDHDARRAWASVLSGHCDMAFLIKPTPIAAVQRIADAGRVMPRKSTYFAPKVITGLVMHAL
jgi:uncharacterized protein (DUF1015 family)